MLTTKRLCSDFTNVVLIGTLPGALNRLTGSSAKLDFHSKIISEATFCIIGLTKTAKIEFLPLDWIYRILTVNFVKLFTSVCCLQMTGFHGVNLRDNELEFFQQRNLSIAHCPNSNLK